MPQLLKTFNLSKDYGNDKGAFDIDLQINSGEIVGFLGPNGAGKTTTISMLTGLIKPTAGSFEIFGRPRNYLNVHKIMPKIGVLYSEVAFDGNLTARQIFRQSEKLLNLDLTSRWQELADFLDLDLDKQFKSFSLGNRKKVGIIQTVMHSPELLIMDEPTSGLDPLIQQKYLQILKDLVQKGSSVLLSSHVLSEVQSVCDRVIMIKNGRIFLQDTTDKILKKSLKAFKIKNFDQIRLKKVEQLTQKIEHIGNETWLYVSDREPILKSLIENGVYDFYLEKLTLEEMFLQYYG